MKIEELSTADRELVDRAREACGDAFAPHSGFRVGAAARLANGRIVTGANQESDVLPEGVCAERALLFHWQSRHYADPIEALAIVSIPGERECSPCGACRQTLLDCERRQGVPIRVLMCSDTTVSIVPSALTLLPYAFEL